MRIAQKILPKQTSKQTSTVLCNRLRCWLVLLALTGHRRCPISTWPSRPKTQLQKSKAQRKTLLCSHHGQQIHFSLLKLLVRKQGGNHCHGRQILRSRAGQLSVSKQHRHSDHDRYHFTF